MAISVTLRGNNTGSPTSGTDATFYVLGISPDPEPIGEVKVFTGNSPRNRKGFQYRYGVKCIPFRVESAAGSGDYQDFGDLTTLREVMQLHRYLWIYSVSGSSRVDANGDPFWSTHGLPVSVALDGAPTAATTFAGDVNFEFELLGTVARFS